jgi:hypothetical protein
MKPLAHLLVENHLRVPGLVLNVLLAMRLAVGSGLNN